MRAVALLLILLPLGMRTGIAQGDPGPEPPSALGARVLTADELRLAGVRRPGDIFRLLDDRAVASVDGFTPWWSPRGLVSYQRGSWEVLLDGEPVPLGIFATTSLDRLPITLDQIDSLEIVERPGVHAGRPVRGGIIHVHTRRPARGLAFRARASTANETGDPGPFAFTRFRTRNIDRIGSGGSAVVSYGGDRLWLEAAGLAREHFVTDPLIARRTFAITHPDDYPIIGQAAVSLRAGWATGTAEHRIFLGRSWTRDYFFLKPFGREVPVESPFTRLAVTGDLEPRPDLALRYRAAYTRNELDRHRNTLDLDFDWALTRWDAGLTLDLQRPVYNALFSIAIARAAAETGFDLRDDDYLQLTLTTELAHTLLRPLQQAVSLTLQTAAGRSALSAALRQSWRPATDQALSLIVAYDAWLPADDGRIWFWAQRGYGFLGQNGVDVSGGGGLTTARRLAADLSWQVRPLDPVSLTIDAYLRSFSDLLLEERRFQPAEAGVFSGPVRLQSDRGGELLGAGVRAVAGPAPGLILTTSYRFQDVVGGDPAFTAVWRSVRRHLAVIEASYRPRADLGLRLSVGYRGSSFWEDYRGIDAATDRFSARLDDALGLDLSLEKWFWDERLRANLLFQNVLNDAEPLHPIGAAYDLSFALQGELRLARR